MARFRFSLQPVLDARQREEQQKQRAVAEIERRRRDLEQALRDHQASLATDKSVLRSELAGPIDVHALRLRAGASLHVMRKAQRVVLELAGVHTQLERARGELLEASKRRRAVELLREKRYEQWRAQQKRAENAAADELAVMRAGRPGGGYSAAFGDSVPAAHEDKQR